MGLSTIKQRINKQKVIICKRDKTDRLVAMGPDQYIQMGEPHILNDKIIDPEGAKQIQRKLNQHTSAWIKITDLGGEWNHTKRFRETALNKTASIPSLSLLVKDYKKIGEGDTPKARPVVASQGSMNFHLNRYLSQSQTNLGGLR